MSDNKTKTLQDFEFPDSQNWFTKYNDWLYRKFISFVGLTTLAPPIVYKGKGIKNWFSPKMPDLNVLGGLVGFSDPESQERLAFHKRRFKTYKIIMMAIYSLLCLSIIPLGNGFPKYAIASTMSASYILGVDQSVSIVFLFLVTILFLFFVFIWASIAIRIASILTDKHYSESLCLISCIYLLVELSRNNALVHPTYKRAVLHSMSMLERNTRLMTHCYDTKGNENHIWLRKHFRNMELYVNQRERWVIAPTDGSLSDLRRDFLYLGNLFISGNYGDYKCDDELTKLIDKPEESKKSKLFQTVIRIFGIVTPIAMLSTLFVKPIIFTSLGLNSTVVALLAFAWLLLVIDAYLNLGIVDRVTGIAKAIKDLSG